MHKLILFDIDGTLVHTRGAGREAFKRTLLDVFGDVMDVDTFHFGGKTDWGVLNEMFSRVGLTHDDIGQQMPRIREIMARHLDAVIGDFPVIACPGAHDLVADLRKREDILLGIVSGNTSATAPIKLSAAGFDPIWFPIGAYGDESYDRNQLPPIALGRAQQFSGHSISPQSVFVIGDTPADVECARALGAVAVAVCTGFSPREDLLACEPDVLLTDLTRFWDAALL